jgi:hypothetical protein
VSLTRTTREGADKSQPVHIVEVGAGHGKMAFLMVTKLLELREFFPVERPFKYVMTDFTQVRCVARVCLVPSLTEVGSRARSCSTTWTSGGRTRRSRRSLRRAGLTWRCLVRMHARAAPPPACLATLAQQTACPPSRTDAAKHTEIKLAVSGAVLSAETTRAPLVGICNYVFDTLCQDAFRHARCRGAVAPHAGSRVLRGSAVGCCAAE